MFEIETFKNVESIVQTIENLLVFLKVFGNI